MSFSDSGSIRPAQLGAYAELFERIADPTFLLDPISYVILAMNPSAQKKLGEEAHRLWGRSLLQLVPDTQRGDFAKTLRISLRRDQPQRFPTSWKTSPVHPFERLEMIVCAIRLDGGSGQRELLQVTARFSDQQKSSIISTPAQTAKTKKKVS